MTFIFSDISLPDLDLYLLKLYDLRTHAVPTCPRHIPTNTLGECEPLVVRLAEPRAKNVKKMFYIDLWRDELTHDLNLKTLSMG